jgi:peptidoglycan/LPS O-acetylase OafA/YrhL
MAEKYHASPRLLYMDFLRAIAILYIVVVHHLDDYAGNIYQSKLDDILRALCLGLFMFISGYLLSLNAPIHNKGDLWDFMRRRFLRIYPLYVLALFLFMLCSIMSFKSVLLHMALLNVLLNKSVITLWFVSIICIFYIIYPIIVYKYSVPKTVIIFVSLCSVFILLKETLGLLDETLILYFPLFILGIVSLKHKLIDRFIHNRIFVICSILVFIVSTYLYFEAPKFHQIFEILLMMSAVPFLILIGKLVSPIVNKRVYVNIAYASFCMYLFHRVIYYLITHIYSPSNNIYMVIYLTLIAVPIVYVTSFYLQKYYDRITRRIRANA